MTATRSVGKPYVAAAPFLRLSVTTVRKSSASALAGLHDHESAPRQYFLALRNDLNKFRLARNKPCKSLQLPSNHQAAPFNRRRDGE
jgi:hypothetical protein